MNEMLNTLGKNARNAEVLVRNLSANEKNEVLLKVAEALTENADREGISQRIAEMTDFLNKQSAELEEYDEQLVRRLIEKVTIYEDKLTVEFKSVIEIDEEI